MNRKKLAVLLMAVFATAMTAAAQNESSKQKSLEFYRLDFALNEMDGAKAVKTHNYQMIVAGNVGTSSIRSGTKVPVSTDNKGAFTYLDVGVKLDIRNLWTTKDELEFDIVAEASVVTDTAAQSIKNPMIYQTQWNSRVQIPMAKPTVIFLSDDPASKRQLQLEVTATPLR